MLNHPMNYCVIKLLSQHPLITYLHLRSRFQKQLLATAVSDLTWKWHDQLLPLGALNVKKGQSIKIGYNQKDQSFKNTVCILHCPHSTYSVAGIVTPSVDLSPKP